MSIRKIRANTATIDGDFIIVESDSLKPLGIFMGYLVGFVACLLYDVTGFDMFVTIIVASFLGAVVGFLIFPGRIVRQIPLVDLVEIKRYKISKRVTVVLDDARTKRRQPEAVKE